MTEEQLNNIDKPEFPSPIQGWKPTAQEAIQAVNRLLWSDGVEDDDYEEAKTIKAFLVDTLTNIPAPVKHSKTIPVMETTIEGAQKRVANVIELIEKGWWGQVNDDLEYIAVFLDSVGDEMAAMSTSYNSLHERYVQALRDVAELRRENGEIRRGNLNNLHAAHDNQ